MAPIDLARAQERTKIIEILTIIKALFLVLLKTYILHSAYKFVQLYFLLILSMHAH